MSIGPRPSGCGVTGGDRGEQGAQPIAMWVRFPPPPMPYSSPLIPFRPPGFLRPGVFFAYDVIFGHIQYLDTTYPKHVNAPQALVIAAIEKNYGWYVGDESEAKANVNRERARIISSGIAVKCLSLSTFTFSSFIARIHFFISPYPLHFLLPLKKTPERTLARPGVSWIIALALPLHNPYIFSGLTSPCIQPAIPLGVSCPSPANIGVRVCTAGSGDNQPF